MDTFKVAELKGILQFLEKPTSGTKSNLMQRLNSTLDEKELQLERVLESMREQVPQVAGGDENNVVVEENEDIQVGEGAAGEGGEDEGVNEIMKDGVYRENMLRRSESQMSLASSRGSSAGSGMSSASLTERQRASVRHAKIMAKGKKRRELVEAKARLQRLEIEADEAEVIAEEEEWLRIEARSEAGVEDREPRSSGTKSKDVFRRPSRDPIERPSERGRSLDGLRISFDTRKEFGNGNTSNRRIAHTGSFAHDERLKHPVSSDRLLRDLVRYNELAKLPKRDIEVFDGNVEKYLLFRTAFIKAVGGGSLEDCEKLYYLHQYTAKRPKKIVESCLYLDESEGYTHAWELLDDRYGCTDRIGNAYIQKLLTHANIPKDDYEALDEYVIDLETTRNAVGMLPHGMAELNNPGTIRTIVSKLAASLQDSWSRKASKFARRNGNIAGFNEVLGFVRDEASAMNNPQYGRCIMKVPIGKYGELKQRRTVVGLARQKYNCLKCEGDHDFKMCHELRMLSNQEKRNFLSAHRLCFMCLEAGHMARACNKPEKCGECSAWHNTFLHTSRTEGSSKEGSFRWNARNSRTRVTDEVAPPSGSGEATHVEPFPSGPRAAVMSNSAMGPYSGGLAVVPVDIHVAGGHMVRTSALLDSGSAITMCSADLLRRLRLAKRTIPTVKLTVETVIGECTLDGSFVEGLVLHSIEGDQEVKLPPVYSTLKIPISKDDAVSNFDLKCWSHFDGIKLPSVGNVEIIIGANAPAASEPLEVLHAPKKGEPYGIRTRLGWIVCGVGSCMKINSVKVGQLSVKNEPLHDLVQRAFDIDFDDIGASDRGLSGEDKKWLEIVRKGCIKKDGRYEIPLPIRSENIDIPSTKAAAVSRLCSLKRKFLKDNQLASRYAGVIRDMILKGYAEAVPVGQVDNTKVWYIPHFSVVNPMKPEKTRVVFDCAAKIGGMCLNDLLISGPSLGNELLDVLLRFREGKYAYTADIEAMFHQVKVPVQQRDYLRFLWWADDLRFSSVIEYRMTVHLFGACSSPSVAAFALQQAAKEPHRECSSDARETILLNFYVDDCLKAGNSVEALIDCDNDLRKLCSEAGFNLEKHRATFEAGERFQFGGNPCDKLRALGIIWDLKDDNLWPSATTREVPNSRRQLLSVVASVYDPLGIVAPFLLRGRHLLQETFRTTKKMTWDDRFDREFARRVVRWFNDIENCSQTFIPRNILSAHGEDCKYQLHMFSDASNEGYSVVSYLRTENGPKIECRFIWGKSRVNPVKEVSIPRLELVAAVLSSKMRARLVKCLKVELDGIFMWTDSMTVIRYIQNERDRFNVFVANRITVIKERTSVDEWRHVSSRDNPADDGSRAYQSGRWCSGPDFLLQPVSNWPLTGDDGVAEIVLEFRTSLNVVPVTVSPVDRIIGSFSSWQKLKVCVGWLLLYKSFIASRECPGESRLSAANLEEAEMELVKYEQRKYYKREILSLNLGAPVGRKSTVWKLDVFLREGVIRVGGRLRRTELGQIEKFPAVLPKDSKLVSLIVIESHERLGHLGAATVLADVRQRYWITSGHSTVRRVLRNCTVCRRVRGQVMQQKMADLPSERVQPGVAPFENTGLDCFGPFIVKKGRRTEKRYGVIFTCLAMRAVHLEVANDLSTDAMCNAVRRFMARRGNVKKFLSDNGTNFVGTRKEIFRALLNDETKNKLRTREITWEFNPPGGSHFGGVWERLIRVVRRVLEAMLGKQILTDDGLRTFMCEAEVAVNSRPLTLVTSDSRDLEALTPNKLLTLGGGLEPWGTATETDLYSQRRWKHIQHLSDQFWRRWCKEYRTLLQERRKWIRPKKNVAIDDVVVLVSETEARCHWPLGRVTKIFEGQDGLVRSVDVLSNGKVYRRPVAKLVMLLETEELI